MDPLWEQIEQLSAPDQQELLIRCLRGFAAVHGPYLTRDAIHQSRLYEGDWQHCAFAPEDCARHCEGSSSCYFAAPPSGDDPPSANRDCQRLVRLFGYEMEVRTTTEQVALLAQLIHHYEGLNGPWLAADAIVTCRLPTRT